MTFAIVGAGGRGRAYAEWIRDNPALGRVVAVAEPRSNIREAFARRHGIVPDMQFESWQELATHGRLADAVAICTQDRDHRAPAEVFARDRWHLLLEKPMATTVEDCLAIAKAVDASGSIAAVCHVVRYSPYSTAVKQIVESGRLGDIEGVQHLEPVGYWHFAHSYVRGPWRREEDSTSLLMAKSCHDVDWIQYIVGRPFRRVSSFGSLRYFTPSNQPAGAAHRCVECAVADQCPYDARRIYSRRLALRTWPVHHVIDTWDESDLAEALRSGPYGRCVFACDNNVVDQQVVSMEFDNGVTASFTLNGFTPLADRKTRIFGSRGWLEGDGRMIRLLDFLTESTEEIAVETPGDGTAGGGHAGGDAGLMDAFTRAVATGDRSLVRSGMEESLASHLAVFAAERARRNGTVEPVMSLGDNQELREGG